MASDVTSLTDLAQSLLVVAEASLATTAAGTPDIAYIDASTPAFDCCPAVIVHVQQLTEEATSPLFPTPVTGMRAQYGRVNLATLVVTALRCAAKPERDGSVLIADKEAVAVMVQEDAWALWNGLYHAIQNEVFSDLCSIVHFDRGASIPAQGGCVGWQFVVRAELAGIPNPGPGT